MLDKVLKTISRYNMRPEGVRVIAAVSGGADSVCLLHVLREIAPEALAGVAHFNHQLRGEASNEDERFVGELARAMNLPFFATHEAIGTEHDNLEQAGHRARKRFFRELTAGGAFQTVAVGHTRDDQAETVLFRMLRGSGMAGLAGIAPIAKGIIRPLIDVTRAEVLEFLRSRSIAWREDSTNAEPTFARNRIRHHLMPQLAREWNPNIVDALARTADLAFEEERWWAAEIERITAREFVRSHGGVELRWATFSAMPRATARRLVRRAIAEVNGNLRRIDFAHIDKILEMRSKVGLPSLIVTRSLDWLRFECPAPARPVNPLPIPKPGAYPSPDGAGEICVEFAQPATTESRATLKVEASNLIVPLVLRGWRPGDHYRPQGQSRDRTIQEMFQKARVPCWRRASWPIVTCGDKILWARQFGVAEEAANLVEIRERALS